MVTRTGSTVVHLVQVPQLFGHISQGTIASISHLHMTTLTQGGIGVALSGGCVVSLPGQVGEIS